MPRYFLHLFNSLGRVEDEEGEDLPDLEAARVKAVTAIRSILGEEAKSGKIDLRGRIEIADDRRVVVDVVPFSSAIQLHTGEPGD